ncbi:MULTISPECIES: CooT family nickel-binding protein [Eubacterium]|jgi:predicted RNA-binding protein|uniref:Predicted RNA-binding protein n=2 Tax=Eubacterium TaxID=1730 RepID=A0A1H3XJV0_9FIRM|nr:MULTISPECIES: CooT family nickel-binding protein [Eubacterium]MDD4690711.1 CooT family nickel-binding protein [Eubacterium aggregans]MEA5072618.1 CooT family nickel-binding protein [Eubacterium aggregans]SDX77617.1 Predicted RNA-binding protein [Eubacterium barkeri]SDZ99211.1 Predicted RNA-binding protein [Eubacterium aggregans]
MCESAAFFVNKQGNEEKIMDYVIDIRPSEDGGLVLSDLLGETKSIRGRLKEVQLLQHRILIEETDA